MLLVIFPRSDKTVWQCDE